MTSLGEATFGPFPAAPVRIDGFMAYHSGIGTHIRGLMEGLARNPRCPHLVVHVPDTCLVPHPIEAAQLFPGRLYGIRRRISLPDPGPTCLLHFPHWNVPLLGAKSPPRVVTIHDLNHLRIPEVGGSSMRRAYIRRWIWDAIRGAAAVVTGSHHAREDIIREFGCPPDRISVIGNGISQSWIPLEESELEERLARMKIRHPYLVSVGNSKPHKNISWMVQEVTKWLDRQGLPHGIVLTSPAGKLPGRGARVVHTGPLDQSDMRAIIQGAAALIQPSLYEGFGLPVIEAQALKTPVLVSTAASLPEVSGGTSSACLFDPRSPLELAGALERGLDPSNRIALVTAGLANAQSHTWDAVAERLLSVWHWVLRNHP